MFWGENARFSCKKNDEGETFQMIREKKKNFQIYKQMHVILPSLSGIKTLRTDGNSTDPIAL